MTTKILLYAFLTGFSLILGVILGTTLKFSQKIIAAIMACIYRPKSDHEDTGKAKTDAESI